MLIHASFPFIDAFFRANTVIPSKELGPTPLRFNQGCQSKKLRTHSQVCGFRCRSVDGESHTVVLDRETDHSTPTGKLRALSHRQDALADECVQNGW
jgi:hypothetical protein